MIQLTQLVHDKLAKLQDSKGKKFMDPTRCLNKVLGTMIQCYEMTRLSLAQTVEVKTKREQHLYKGYIPLGRIG